MADTIVEPFAGSAGYALHYPKHNVRLYDIDPVIVGVWDYLINVKEKDLLALPDFERGPKPERGPPDYTLADLDIPDAAKHLIGFWITESQTYPSNYHLSPTRDGSWSKRKREMLAEQLQYIRCWRVEKLSYTQVDISAKATWFVDPPYQGAGKRYRYGNKDINYKVLGAWCKALRGQVIVCESAGADWLPFRPFAHHTNGSNKSYPETIWTKEFA